MKKLLSILLLTINLTSFGQTINIAQVSNNRPTALGGSIPYFGTSITVGYLASSNTYRYSTLTSGYLGVTEINLGVSGSEVENRTPSNGFTNFITRLTGGGGVQPTTYVNPATTPFIVLEPGPNDFVYSDTNHNPTNYSTDLTYIINYIHNTYGWPYGRILVLSNPYLKNAIYGTTNGSGILLTSVLYQQFITNTYTVASGLGCMTLDIFTPFNNGLGDLLLADNLHENDRGYKFMAQLIANKLSPIIFQPSLDINKGILMGVDSVTGKFGSMNYTPNHTTLINPYISGQLLSPNITQTGSGYTLGATDWNLNNFTIVTQDALYFTKTSFDGSANGLEFTTSRNSSGAVIFKLTNGAGTIPLSITQAGAITSLGSFNVPYGSFGIYSPGLGESGYFYPQSAGANTDIGSTHDASGAAIRFFQSLGSNGSSNESTRAVNHTGDWLFGGTADAGYRIDNYYTTRSQGLFAIGILSTGATPTCTPSPSGGTLGSGGIFYKIVPVDAFTGQALPGSAGVASVTGPTGSVGLTWTATTGASSYQIWSSTDAVNYTKYFTSTTNSTTDTGSGYITATIPSVNTSRTAQITAAGAGAFSSLTVNGSTTPTIKAANRLTAQTAASSLSAYTVGASDGSFIISSNVLVTASTTHSFSITCTYTDEGNTSRTLTLNVSQLTGAFITAITNVTGASAYEGVPVHIRAKAGTTITLATTGTFTSVTYNFEGVIQQVN